MASKEIKTIARFNALKLVAYQLRHQCSALGTFFDMGVPEELIEEIDKEIKKIVNSLEFRSEKLNSNCNVELINLVEISQRDISRGGL